METTPEDIRSKMVVSNTGFGIGEYHTSKPNILKNDGLVHQISEMFEHLDSAINRTIGPYGLENMLVTYYDHKVPVYATGDGYTIIQNTDFVQPIPKAIFKVIKEISEYMQFKVGDSTSSGIPISSCLYKYLIKLYTSSDNTNGGWKFSPVGIKNIMSILSDIIIEGIDGNPLYQLKLSDLKTDDDKIEILTKLATISANNNYSIGKTVADLYRDKLDGKSGLVLVDSSDSEETEIINDDSFDIPNGLMDIKEMSNTVGGMTCEFKDPNIAIFDAQVFSNDIPALIRMIKYSVGKCNKPIVIAAQYYDNEVMQFFIRCIRGEYFDAEWNIYDNGKTDSKIPPLKVPIATIILTNKIMHEMYSYDDVVLMLGATPFSSEMAFKFSTEIDDTIVEDMFGSRFGHCKNFSSGYGSTYFRGLNPDKDILEGRIKELEVEINKQQMQQFHINIPRIDSIKQRLQRLYGNTTTIKIGARSQKVKYSEKLVYEDAVEAVKSAILDDGVSIGGNIAISHYCFHNEDEIIDKAVYCIINSKKNITAGSTDQKVIQKFVKDILGSIQYSFGQGYRYAIFNMNENAEKTIKLWDELTFRTKPTIFNIMSKSVDNNGYERFAPFDENGKLEKDPSQFTNVISPRKTDIYLLNIIIETVGMLLNVNKMVTRIAPDMDLNEIRIQQLKNNTGK